MLSTHYILPRVHPPALGVVRTYVRRAASTSMGWGATMMPLLQRPVCHCYCVLESILFVGSRERWLSCCVQFCWDGSMPTPCVGLILGADNRSFAGCFEDRWSLDCI